MSDRYLFKLRARAARMVVLDFPVHPVQQEIPEMQVHQV
jgi:hypothetical protein